RARPEWASGRRTERFGSVAELEALPGPPAGEGWLYAWAWLDEPSGRVRARGFPRRPGGVAEDEATGAAAIVLTAELGRQLDIHQGRASLIRTRPGPDGTVEVGGRVLPVEARIVEACPAYGQGTGRAGARSSAGRFGAGRAARVRPRRGPDGRVGVGGRVLPVEARIVEACPADGQGTGRAGARSSAGRFGAVAGRSRA